MIFREVEVTKSELRQHEKDCIFYKYKLVYEMRKDAEGGNGEAMYQLGMWYKIGYAHDDPGGV